jgi:arylsulfatase A-like enzyme
MSKNPEPLLAGGIWSHLICGGAAVGVLMGLVEVCWTYLLPVSFPGRRYELPISAFGRFVFFAIVTDIFLMLVGAAFLGVLFWLVRKLWRRAGSFHYWPALIRFMLIAGALSYLYVGIVYSYFSFSSERLKLQTAIVSILPVVLTSIAVVWLVGMLVRKFGRAAPVTVWVLAMVVLICAIVSNYLLYRSANTVDMDLPVLRTDDAPNLLLVTLDTLRADHLACYGNRIVQTPVLDALAADGCLFEAAFAQAPTTTPSHCSIMTSTYVTRNDSLNGCAMKVGFATLAEILQANGYETTAFVSATPVRSTNSGLQRGFDYYEDSISLYKSLLRNDEYQFVLLTYLFVRMQNSRIPGYIVSNRALSWLEKRGQGPFFCWLHYFDPHDPYDAPAPYRDMYDGKIDPNLPYVLDRSRYAGEVTYTDYELGRIIKALKDKGLYDDMLIIVTSDHGEAFGERHGDITEYRHGQHLYDTTQHVPLIIKLPGAKAAGKRIKDIVQLIDLAPTLLDYLDASLPGSFQGTSLLDLLNGRRRSEPGVAYAERMDLVAFAGESYQQRPRQRRLMSMRTPDIKYICNVSGQRQELYDVVSDPAETVNLYRDGLELAEACYKNVRNVLGDSGETGVTDLDPRVLEQLKSLGYIDDKRNAKDK